MRPITPILATVIIASALMAPSAHSAPTLGRSGKYTCGIKMGTQGIRLALESRGPAHEAAMTAIAEGIGAERELVRKASVKSGFANRQRSLLFAIGDDPYFCG